MSRQVFEIFSQIPVPLWLRQAPEGRIKRPANGEFRWQQDDWNKQKLCRNNTNSTFGVEACSKERKQKKKMKNTTDTNEYVK
jgi:hypothetical protein